MRNFFKQYFYLLDAEARRRLPFLVLMFVVSSVLDVIGIGTVGVFLVMISSPEKILHYLPFASTLQTIPAHSLLLGTGCVVIVAFMLKAWLSCIIQKQVVFFGFRYALKLKLRLMEFYQYAPYSFHLKQNSAYLIDRMNQIDIYVAAFLIPSLMLLSNVLVSVFVVSLLFTVHPFATLALGGVFALIFWISGRVLKNKAREYGRIVSTSAAEINKNVQHALVGLKEVRVFGGEPYFFNRVERQADLFAKAQAMNMFYQLVPRALTEAVLAIFIIVLCLLSLSAGMTTSQIVAFVGVFAAAGSRLLPTMTQLTAGINQLRFSYQNMLRVSEIFQDVSKDSQRKIPPPHETQMPFSNLALVNIEFRYATSRLNALNGVSLHLKKGQSLGLIGTSGSGKSTLVSIILGLLEPEAGQILVDGKAIQDLRAWMNHFAYIPQHIFLMDDSLKRNVALGVEDADIDMDRLHHALKMAQLDEVVSELSDGVETLLGEHGVRLSGGQRQRVALARAFYHERDIIVMDEATSALDNDTEQEVIRAIRSLKGQKTMIVIAHRLSTVEHCDVICRLERGRIVDSGSFANVVQGVE